MTIQRTVLLPYFTPREVSVHNVMDDIWVSFLGKVYELTNLCKIHTGDLLMKPIVLAAGTDISHWFDEKTGDVRKHIDPRTNCLIPYCPNGRFLHIPPPYPDTEWVNDFGRPWWRDDNMVVGFLSQKTRFINIVNTLTSQSHVIEVCTEESMNEILLRYLKYNAHAQSYTWKYDGRKLDMDKTLTENEIKDEDEEFYDLSMNTDTFLQCVHLYFNDDLTEDDLEHRISLIPDFTIDPKLQAQKRESEESEVGDDETSGRRQSQTSISGSKQQSKGEEQQTGDAVSVRFSEVRSTQQSVAQSIRNSQGQMSQPCISDRERSQFSITGQHRSLPSVASSYPQSKVYNSHPSLEEGSLPVFSHHSQPSVGENLPQSLAHQSQATVADNNRHSPIQHSQANVVNARESQFSVSENNRQSPTRLSQQSVAESIRQSLMNQSPPSVAEINRQTSMNRSHPSVAEINRPSSANRSNPRVADNVEINRQSSPNQSRPSVIEINRQSPSNRSYPSVVEFNRQSPGNQSQQSFANANQQNIPQQSQASVADINRPMDQNVTDQSLGGSPVMIRQNPNNEHSAGATNEASRADDSNN